MGKITGQEIRQTLLSVLHEHADRGGNNLQSDVVLRESASRLNMPRTVDNEQALLTFWQDLFRSGHLA